MAGPWAAGAAGLSQRQARSRHEGRWHDRHPADRDLVEDAGYHGLIEVEIFSKLDWWRRDPDEMLAVIAERYRSVV